MSTRTRITPFRYNENAYLLVALLLSNYIIICTGIVTENIHNSIDEETTRPEVKIPQGTLRGVNLLTHHNRKIFGFKGIPFAKPPVGNLRFKRPVPPDRWNGTLDASSDSTPCPQIDNNVIIGDEDCLYLSVYTPKLPATGNSTLLPVMLFIFGGKHEAGDNNSTRWGPYFLLDKDVVLVVPKYRLGVLGFLSTGDEVLPGNNGLKDMVRSLEWNRDNIRHFGGDPDRVTLIGGSSGAASVHILTLSNSTNGLFHRYITQSGTALWQGCFRSRNQIANDAIRLGEYLGCPTNTSKLLVNCLTKLNTSILIDTDYIFDVWNDFPKVVWGPTVEQDIEGALLIDTPVNLVAAGKVRDLPWISTIARDEGIIVSAQYHRRPDLFEELLHNLDDILPLIIQYGDLVENVTAYTQALKSYYMNDLTASRTLLLANFTKLVTDASFAYPAYYAAQQQMVHAKSPQFLCSMEYRGTLTYSYYFSGGSTEYYGVAHNEEMLYLFENQNNFFGPPGTKMNEVDWELVDRMVQLWTSFAFTGKPTITEANRTIIWEPYSPGRKYLRIGNDFGVSMEVKENFFKDDSQFWEELTAKIPWK